MNSQSTIQTAMQHHQAGRLAEAERLYRQILAQQPNHADALHLMGVLAGQVGQTDAAIDLINRAIKIQPDYVDAYNNLGRVLADKGRLEEAAAAYSRVTQLRPRDAQAYNNLGTVRRNQERMDDGVAAFRRAIEIQPNFLDAYVNLGSLLRSQGKFEESVASYQQAIMLNPESAAAYNNLGNALAEWRKRDEAIAAISKAVQLKPDWADAHFRLGQLLREENRPEEALAAYRRAVEVKPDYVDAVSDLANLLRERGMIGEALAAFLKVVELKPDSALAHFNVGKLQWQAGRFEMAGWFFEQAARIQPDYAEAHANLAATLANLQRFDDAFEAHKRAADLAPDEPYTLTSMASILLHKGDGKGSVEFYRRAAESDPGSALTWNGLGAALRSVGKFEEAAECFRRALEISPDRTSSVTKLASVGRTNVDEKEVARLESVMDNDGASTEDRIAAGFALGKVLDDADRFDEAFARYSQANKLVKGFRESGGEKFDPAQSANEISELMKRFSPEFFSQKRGWGEDSELPVFIVGMPRSGTTLVEQIAASHPKVFGAGELRDIGHIAESLPREWMADSIKAAAKRQLTRLRGLGGEASRVIDKLPGNVANAGLIATLFPSARMILCRRDPRDNCLSCFFQLFGTGQMFAYDLEDCGRYCAQIQRLMDYWFKVLPIRMLEIQYETLVGDLEGQSRRLIDFLGLPWDPKCLEFHKTERTVLTASVWQVRQPIYNRSAGRWKHYEKHLGPLMRGLEMDK